MCNPVESVQTFVLCFCKFVNLYRIGTCFNIFFIGKIIFGRDFFRRDSAFGLCPDTTNKSAIYFQNTIKKN